MKPDTREVRALNIESAELRYAEADETRTLEGYFARFNVRSDEMFFGVEYIRPGAFAKTIREADVRAVWNHNSDWVLGRQSSGTLKLSEDRSGGLFSNTPPDTTWARDFAESIRRRDVTEVSFAFRAVREEWRGVGDTMEREIIEAELFDVSPCTYPLYPQTDVAVRSMLRHDGAKDEEIGELSDKLEALRDPELTRAEFRSILDPIQREIRKRHSAPGPKAHPDGENGNTRYANETRALDLMEIE